MSERTAIINARIFDGDRLTAPGTVVVEDGLIGGGDPAGARVVDAAGATLLPGLIDAHLHLDDRDTLERLTAHGVTTGLDMATWPPAKLAALRGVPGLTDIRSAGTPAIGPGGPHSRIPGMAGDAVVLTPAQADSFVAARLAEGSDYLKLVLEAPGEGGPDEDTARALVASAHSYGKKVVAHASSAGAFALALAVGVDILTHVPLGPPLDPALVARLAADGRAVVPTLTMMKGVATNFGKPEAFGGSLRSVTALHAAGVPVLAGTDANRSPGVPARVEHGVSLHQELELLVSAGLSTVEALRAATTLPARWFGLTDRGAIAPGMRADLLLVDGDPIADITATTKIVHVWCGGVQHG
ncbi:amidohydrolase family protein [Micromonosporaceae bacterium Da 78-11]